MVESTALEMRHTGNRIGGSNPSLSANSLLRRPSLSFADDHKMPRQQGISDAFSLFTPSPSFAIMRKIIVGLLAGTEKPEGWHGLRDD